MKSPRLRYSFLLLTASTVLLAQEYRGTIAGIVTDTTGFPVAGEYTAAALLPGEYQIAVRISGFKEYLRKAVHVGAGDRVVIDVRSPPCSPDWRAFIVLEFTEPVVRQRS